MTRAQFLNDLYRRLSGLTQEQAEQHLTYYAEMLADRMEEGMSEEEAVASMEDLDTIVQRILQDEGVRTPERPDPAEASPPPEGKKPGLNWRRLAGIALWAAAIAIAVSALWNRFVPREALPEPEPDTGFHIDASGIQGENFSIGPDGIYASGGGHEVYIGPGGIQVDGGDGGSEWMLDSSAWEQIDRSGYRFQGTAYELPAEGISEVKVEWTAGQVEVQCSQGDVIHFQELATEELTDKIRMVYEVDDGTLTIRIWPEGWVRTSAQKALLVQVPDQLLATLDVETTSANVRISGSYVQEVEVSTTSGNVELTGVDTAELSVSTTSGNVSGDAAVLQAEVETTSGDVSLHTARGESIQLGSTSGDLCLSVADPAVSEIELDTVSGDVSLELPAGLGFTLTFDTVSGDLNTGSHSLIMRDGRYLSGSGGCEIEVDTTSGDLSLL